MSIYLSFSRFSQNFRIFGSYFQHTAIHLILKRLHSCNHLINYKHCIFFSSFEYSLHYYNICLKLSPCLIPFCNSNSLNFIHLCSPCFIMCTLYYFNSIIINLNLKRLKKCFVHHLDTYFSVPIIIKKRKVYC